MNLLTRLFEKSETSSEILCPHCEKAMEASHDLEACARKRMSRRYFFGMMAAVATAAALPPVEEMTGAGLISMWTAGNVLKVGDVIRIGSRHVLNPRTTRRRRGHRFVITEVAESGPLGSTLTLKPTRR